MPHSITLTKPRIAWLMLMSAAVDMHAQMDVQTIIQRSVAANQADWKAAPEYAYKELDREAGNTKTYEITMISGSPYQRLIAVNGKQLSAADSQKEREKLQQATAQRKSESAQDRSSRIEKYHKERERDHLMMTQMTEAFDFKLTGQQKMRSRDVYVLQATPRKGYNPPNNEAKVLTGMKGQLWIDKSTFQWIKVTARVLQPVSIEGFLAQVEPGTYFELEKMPVEGGVWLPKHFAMKAHAKVLFIFNHKNQEDNTFFDYHKGSNARN